MKICIYDPDQGLFVSPVFSSFEGAERWLEENYDDINGLRIFDIGQERKVSFSRKFKIHESN